MEYLFLNQLLGFEWDHGNQHKSWDKHGVTPLECEQIFFNNPLVLYEDDKHSNIEKRFFALGHTDDNRKLFIVFTVRKNHIRVISARNQSKKERRIYEQA